MKPALLVLIFFVTTLFVESQNSNIILASYNLRYENNYDGNNSWQNRVDLVKELISYHEFEIMATQELYVNQINDLLNMEGWSYVGVGRDDGINAG